MKKGLSQLIAASRNREKTAATAHPVPERAHAKSAVSDHPTGDGTGETIFDDRPLRFRSLSVSPADLSTMEAIEGNRGFKIRLAKLSGQRRDAGDMVQQRYARRGYSVPAPRPDPHVSTFIAYDEGIPVGTVSVRLDSEQRLSADDLYGTEIDQLRSSGKRLCELTRLAVDRTTASKPVLAGLFHTAYLYASVIRGITHAVIEVNPRHVAFYCRALGFEAIGPERINRRVNAPAVLLCVPFSAIADGLDKYAGKPTVPGASRSLFLYGFPPRDAPGVLQRLRDVNESA
jgi:hypothetical protein